MAAGVEGPEEGRDAAVLEALEARVLDEGACVTYRTLSRDLGLHVNRAKRLLQQFVDKHGQRHTLSVVEIVCGVPAPGEGAGLSARCLVCVPEDANRAAAAMQRVLYRHVYAVSRAAAEDAVSLAAAADGFEEAAACAGAVRGDYCEKRSRDEIGSLKTNSCRNLAQEVASSSRTPVINNISEKNAPTNSSNNPKTSSGMINEVKESPMKKLKQSDLSVKENKGKSNISSFFGKSDRQRTDKLVVKLPASEQTQTGVESEVKLAPDLKFRSQDNGQTESQTKVEPEVKLEPKSKSSNRDNILSEGQKKVESKLNLEPKLKSSSKDKGETKTVKAEENKLSLGKVLNKETSKNKSIINTKRNKVDKKRKRVLHISDSEGSDKDDPFAPGVASDSDEDVIPPTPNNNVVKITSGILNSKKRRKIVDKTYTTDDGYMVTKKEEVYESCSEGEVEMKENIVETNVKKESFVQKKLPALTPKKGRQKKNASPQKGKQASIKSFFKTK